MCVTTVLWKILCMENTVVTRMSFTCKNTVVTHMSFTCKNTVVTHMSFTCSSHVNWVASHTWMSHVTHVKDMCVTTVFSIHAPPFWLPPLLHAPHFFPGNVTDEERVLDMCASPGSKATQLLGLHPNFRGLFIANVKCVYMCLYMYTYTHIYIQAHTHVYMYICLGLLNT